MKFKKTKQAREFLNQARGDSQDEKPNITLPKPIQTHRNLKRKYQIGIYLNEKEIAFLDEQAQIYGMNRNSYVRMVLFNSKINKINNILGQDDEDQ